MKAKVVAKAKRQKCEYGATCERDGEEQKQKRCFSLSLPECHESILIPGKRAERKGKGGEDEGGKKKLMRREGNRDSVFLSVCIDAPYVYVLILIILNHHLRK